MTDDPELKWLTTSFLEEHLRNYFSSKTLSVQNVQVRPATGKGENFCSTVYRLKVEYVGDDKSKQNLNIILKLALSSGIASEKLSSLNVYGKEIEFYQKIAPKFESLLRENKQLIDAELLLPKVYGFCDVNNALLIEDVSPLGYRIGPVRQGFNAKEAEIILQKVALFHAAGAVLQEREPDIYANFQKAMLTEENHTLDSFYQDQFDAATSVISTWPEYAHYAGKMKKMRNKLIDKILDVLKKDPNCFNTLAHMDLWTNNLLLKYTDICENGVNKIENIVAIDFQYSYWTSPVLDLHYFFHTSVRDSLRPEIFDDLIAFYHDHLESYLKRLNYCKVIPNLEEFREKYFEKIFHGVISSFFIYPILVNEQKDAISFETLTTTGEEAVTLKKLLFTTPKVEANLKKLLPYFDEHGAFD